MSQFGLPGSNDNVLKEGNKLTSMSNQERNEARRRINERRMDSVNISPSSTGWAAFTYGVCTNPIYRTLYVPTILLYMIITLAKIYNTKQQR